MDSEAEELGENLEMGKLGNYEMVGVSLAIPIGKIHVFRKISV